MAPPPGSGEPVRVGIVSEYFRNHSVWKLNISGWLRRLDRRKFRVFGYHTGKRRDATTTEALATCCTVRRLRSIRNFFGFTTGAPCAARGR